MAKDQVKTHIAAEVRAALKQFDLRGILGDPAYEVSTSAVSPLETQVRVKIPVGGVRYFTVKVSEHY